MTWNEATKINLEIQLRKLMQKHFGLFLKLSQTNTQSDNNPTKDIWEEMKLIDKKIKEIQKELEVYKDFLND